jgi:hypothetical protein
MTDARSGCSTNVGELEAVLSAVERLVDGTM